MHHGTVCVILSDGSNNCPAFMLPKKKGVGQQIKTSLTPHDRFKLMMMQDSGVNLNHLIAASKVIDFYNEVKKNEAVKNISEITKFGFDTAMAVSGQLAAISRSFVDKMDRLNAMQFRLMGAQGKELAAARKEFKAAYFDAMDELNNVSKLNYVTPESQLYFDNQMRVRAFGRAGVYVNDLDEVERLSKIARNTHSINSAVAKFAVLAGAGEIIYDAVTGGDWQKDIKDITIEYIVAKGIGLAFSWLTPGGWIILLLECTVEVFASDKISYLLENPSIIMKFFKENS